MDIERLKRLADEGDEEARQRLDRLQKRRGVREIEDPRFDPIHALLDGEPGVAALEDMLRRVSRVWDEEPETVEDVWLPFLSAALSEWSFDASFCWDPSSGALLLRIEEPLDTFWSKQTLWESVARPEGPPPWCGLWPALFAGPETLNPYTISGIFGSPSLSTLRRLYFSRSNHLGDDGLAALLIATRDAPLTHLGLESSHLSDASARAIATSASLEQLTHLILNANELSAEGVQALARSSVMKNLKRLALGSNPIGDRGVERIARASALQQLEGLGLGHVGVGESGIRALCQAPSMARLTELNLTGNNLGDAGAVHLARSPHLRQLTRLYLGSNRIGDRGVIALARSAHLEQLVHLRLANNQMRGPAAAIALANSPALQSLTYLDLRGDTSGNHIGDEGVEAIAASPHLEKLRDLHLESVGCGDRGARALASAPCMKNLTRLVIGYNQITDEGAIALSESTHLTALTHLYIYHNEIGERGEEAFDSLRSRGCVVVN